MIYMFREKFVALVRGKWEKHWKKTLKIHSPD